MIPCETLFFIIQDIFLWLSAAKELNVSYDFYFDHYRKAAIVKENFLNKLRFSFPLQETN